MSLAIENRIFEPSTFARLVLQKAVRQREPQRTDRTFIQLPQLRVAGQVIRRRAAHALADSPSAIERVHNCPKPAPNFRDSSGIASEAIDREFVGAQLSAPFEQAPGFLRGEIAGSEVAFNERQ